MSIPKDPAYSQIDSLSGEKALPTLFLTKHFMFPFSPPLLIPVAACLPVFCLCLSLKLSWDGDIDRAACAPAVRAIPSSVYR